jgi:hypothetical protein
LWNGWAADHHAAPEIEPRKLTMTSTTQTLPAETGGTDIRVYCGRRVIKLYGAGRLFACRHCYRLAYASQQESAHQRGLGKSQKIRMRLGGSPNMLEEFPHKPRGMHWRTYERWRRVYDVAEERSTIGLMRFVERLGRRSSRRA